MNNDEHEKKELIAEVFNRAASGYGHLSYFPPLGRRLAELAHIPAGAKALDVACGRGAVLFPAAERVGPQGQVIGIDLSEGMVQSTRAELDRHGVKNVQLRRMDAESLDFPDASFDRVLCGFALFFFPRLERALAEFRRVLKPGGRIVASTWGDDDPRWQWYDELLSRYQAIVKLRSQALDKRGDLQVALDRAGFAEVQVISEEADYWICSDEEAWWAAQWSISARVGLERLQPAALEKLKAEAFDHLRALKQPDGFYYRLQAHFALAARPPV